MRLTLITLFGVVLAHTTSAVPVTGMQSELEVTLPRPGDRVCKACSDHRHPCSAAKEFPGARSHHVSRRRERDKGLSLRLLHA